MQYAQSQQDNGGCPPKSVQVPGLMCAEARNSLALFKLLCKLPRKVQGMQLQIEEPKEVIACFG